LAIVRLKISKKFKIKKKINIDTKIIKSLNEKSCVIIEKNKKELNVFLFQSNTPLFHSKIKPNINIIKKKNKIKIPKNLVITIE